MAPGGNQATYLSLLLTTFTSSDMPLSTAHEPSVSFSLPYHTIHVLIIIAPDWRALQRPCFLIGTLGSHLGHESPCHAQSWWHWEGPVNDLLNPQPKTLHLNYLLREFISISVSRAKFNRPLVAFLYTLKHLFSHTFPRLLCNCNVENSGSHFHFLRDQ